MDLIRYKIGMDFLTLYDRAEESNTLETKEIELELNSKTSIGAVINALPSNYDEQAGKVVSPNNLEGEIVQYMPLVGWVPSELSYDLWY
jgi:hypothetical protein